MFVGQRSEDVTIDIGIRITDDCTVCLCNLMIAIEVSKVDITCLVVVAVDTVLFEYEQISSLSLSRCREDTSSPLRPNIEPSWLPLTAVYPLPRP